MKMKLIQLTPIFTIVILISCFEKKQPKEAADLLPSVVIGEIIKTSQNCNPDSVHCSYAKIEYPVFTDSTKSKLNDLIFQKIKNIAADYVSKDAASGTLEHIAQSFIYDYEAFKVDFPKYSFGWYLTIKAEIIYETANIISLRIDNEAFTGGAHPNSATAYFVIDASSNRELTTKDIIGDTVQFKKLLEREFRKVKGMDDNQSFADVGYYVNDGDFILNNNIGLTAGSVIVHFNPYEIAPYSEGATTLELSREKLAGILKIE